MNIVSTIKITEILKYTWFHVIPYIHSPVMGLFPLFPHILNTQYIYILNIQNIYLQEQIINYREPLGILHKTCDLPIVV